MITSYVVDGAGNSKVLYLMSAVGSLCVSARLFDRLEDASKENKSRYTAKKPAASDKDATVLVARVAA